MQNRISSFPPIIDNDSKIIILGSIPGVKSLEKQQYYAHPQNKFWKIIFEFSMKNLQKIMKKNQYFKETSYCTLGCY
jgi:hypoxanthine-DNA glycosylase